MPTNLLKKYPDLLEIGHLSAQNRTKSLQGIFQRDIENNSHFKFRSKQIWPIKGEEPAMQLLFRHLTTEEIDDEDESGKTIKRRIFEMDRSRRLHWIKPHIDEKIQDEFHVFSAEERVKGVTIARTYIYNKVQKYVVVLEPQRTKNDYYLLTAYHLNKAYGEKQIKKKLKKKLPNIL